MHNRIGNVVISIEVQIKIPNGSTLKNSIRIKWFSKNFILTGDLLSGNRSYTFEDS